MLTKISAKIEHDPAENKENVIFKEAKDDSECIHSEACVDEKTKDATVEHIQTGKARTRLKVRLQKA